VSDLSELAARSRWRLRDCALDRIEPVLADTIVDLQALPRGDGRRLEVIVEFDRGRSSAAAEQRLRRYDVLLSASSALPDRHGARGRNRLVVFVCEDAAAREQLVELADRALTTRIVGAGIGVERYGGRHRILFAIERDVHAGCTFALAAPSEPPEIRARIARWQELATTPRRCHIVGSPASRA
jgi:hypothetical protein